MLETEEIQKAILECRAQWGCPPEATLDETLKRVELLRDRKRSIVDALIVVLLGGTKVGKTTLLNALAGRKIGEPSAKACFTDRPAVFVHSSREAQARFRLQGVLKPDDVVVIHEEAPLERLIFIDSPDIDGILIEHHHLFRELLERSDLALCILTTQKYDSKLLFEILGHEVGFRRTAFVFNKIDEGIPFSEPVKKDFLQKISMFNLKPPEGQILPIFAVSAQNAASLKAGRASGPSGDFSGLEKFLRERLDQAVVKRINEENFVAMYNETLEFARKNSLLEEVMEFASKTVEASFSHCKSLNDEITSSLNEIWMETSSALEGRMTLNVIEGVGGPFGIYLKAIVAIRALTSTFTVTIPSVEKSAGLFGKVAIDKIERGSDEFLTSILEEADRLGLDPLPIKKHFEQAGKSLKVLGEEPTAILRRQMGDTRSNTVESLLLNFLPVLILLLLVKYFLVCLIHAKEPSAGMFLGGALTYWLTCHIQAVFWLPRKMKKQISLPSELIEYFNQKAFDRIVVPLKIWKENVEQIAKKFGYPK
ncbi:MAG: 50S ribosome-binding GTPase [Candidatus Riflebacteria bacterium]|nr:50S ribosome-binding GTPase [Candidatus Riflebacteria bacterium]